MDNFWIVIFMMIALMITILIPFFIYMYESDEEKTMVE